MACHKDEPCDAVTGLNGQWIWIESVGGFGGETITPSSANLTRKLVIDDFTYKVFENDSLVFETQYELGISDEPLLGTEERTFIRFGSGEEKAIVLGGNELILTDQCFDCYTHRYRRE